MFLYQSNRLELLLDALCEILAQPLTEALPPEIIVVPHQGMATWLKQQLALRTGIAANIRFPLPGRFFWEIIEAQTEHPPNLDAFQGEVLIWRIYTLLPLLHGTAALDTYLQDDADNRRRHQLSLQITDIFDQYQIYRPDLLSRWEAGEDNHWQAQLWRLLTDTGQGRNHVFTTLLNQHLGAEDLAGQLPERVSLFGINSMAPVHLAILAKTARATAVHLYHLSPCREFWDDITSTRELATLKTRWLRGKKQDLSGYHETGNSLLASLGTLGKTFGRQLLELEEICGEVELYRTGPGTTLLEIVQNDIVSLRDRGPDAVASLPAEDNSIQLHCCHSRVREVQVLHDRLLTLFAADSTLVPMDILVMAPDINAYASAVKGVFGGAPARRYVPWSLADQSTGNAHPLLAMFLTVLTLLDSRCTASAIMELWDCAALLQRFGLQPAHRSLCHRWLADAAIHWGLDQDHLDDLGMDSFSRHTWQHGLDRLLLGCIMHSESRLFMGYAPVPVEPSHAQILGGLAELTHTLGFWRRRCARPATPEHWQRRLLACVDAFFSAEHDEEGGRTVRRIIGDFADACQRAECHEVLTFTVVREYLRRIAQTPAQGQTFLSGRVTFCNMIPMRSLPFKVICLLGMGHADFPRRRRSIEFDLIAADPRPGDRNRRDDDRYLFLEALLSARQVLYLSWVGRSQVDNTPGPPSVVISELTSFLDHSCTLGGHPAGSAILHEHPLQPFSPRCFSPNVTHSSYAREWLPSPEVQQYQGLMAEPLPPPEPAPLPLAELLRFWKSPAATFLQQRLRVNPCLVDSLPADSEPFSLDHLQRYLLTQRLVDTRRKDEDEQQLYRQLKAEGVLPSGGFADHQLIELGQHARFLDSQLRDIDLQPLPPVDLDHVLGDYHLTGRLGNLTAAGLLTWRPAITSPNDLLQLWIQHLVLSLLSPQPCPPVSRHVGRKNICTLGPVDHPEHHLQVLLALMDQGLREPLPFFPRTSHAWAKGLAGKASIEWEGTGGIRGEGTEMVNRLVLGERTPLFTEEFTDIANTVFQPVFDHLV